MAQILEDISRTFSEYLLLPDLTEKRHTPENVSLKTPLSKYSEGESPRISLNIPFVSACMQAVSGKDMGVSLARNGGLAFIFCSQPVEKQAEMVFNVKHHKAGFVESDSNVKPNTKLREVVELSKRTGHSTVAVTENGECNGTFLGIITDKDYWVFTDDLERPVSEFMTPVEDVVFGNEDISLHEANTLLHKHKKECLPIIDKTGNLKSLVFKKDYLDHLNYPLELLDDKQRLIAAAGINTHDYKERVPELIKAGADAFVMDSSEGFSEFQKETAHWVKNEFGEDIIIGGGNVVSADGFRYLAEEGGVDFVKVGIGGGSICITREQKGIGRGQASAVLDVAAERDRYYKETGIYIPICSDGGLSNDTQIILALSMGADFVMMGRYFAMTDESPSKKVRVDGKIYKQYWGEGSNRARNWQRYSDTSDTLKFEEGVDAYVPAVGSLDSTISMTTDKLKSTMCNTGSLTLEEFYRKARLVRISEQSFVEGTTNNVESFKSDVPEV